MGILKDLIFLELLPVLVAVTLWMMEFSNREVKFWYDNQAVVAVVNHQSSRSESVMHLVHRLLFLRFQANNIFLAKFVPGLGNSIIDVPSCSKDSRFQLLVPQANTEPDAFLEEFWTLEYKM